MWDDWAAIERAQHRADHAEEAAEVDAIVERAEAIVRQAADHPGGQAAPSFHEPGLYRTIGGRLVREDFPAPPARDVPTDAEGLRLFITDLRALASRLRGKP